MIKINNVEYYNEDSEIENILKRIPNPDYNESTVLDSVDSTTEGGWVFSHDREMYVVLKYGNEGDSGLTMFKSSFDHINELTEHILIIKNSPLANETTELIYQNFLNLCYVHKLLERN